jgi:hypothetical protein
LEIDVGFVQASHVDTYRVVTVDLYWESVKGTIFRETRAAHNPFTIAVVKRFLPCNLARCSFSEFDGSMTVLIVFLRKP